MSVTNRVREARLAAGLSVSELARRARVARQTLIWIEQAPEHNPHVETMSRIAAELGCEMGDLYRSSATEKVAV